MTLRVALNHHTAYKFDRPVKVAPHTIRLRPAPHTRTPVLGYSLNVDPGDHFLNWQQDPFGNFAARVVFPEPVDHLTIDVEVIVDLSPINPFDFFLEPAAEMVPFTYDDDVAADLAAYREIVDEGPLLTELVGGIDRSEARTLDFMVKVNQLVQSKVGYQIRMEPGVYTSDETLAKGTGSCRDSAWLLTQVLRHVGLAARFVSGYLVQLVADEAPIEGPAGPTADFTDLHAWTEVYLPGAGWVGLDPTSGLLAGEGHIPLAATPHPRSAAPVTGAVDPCETTFEFANVVARIHETPRTTKPYTSEQWTAIDELGHDVEKVLEAGDVRLTVGGEPTFVSIDDPDGPEWHFDADSEEKRALAEVLVHRLKERFAPGGLLHVGEGKWYPGEPLPRWARRVYWRADQHPIWPRTDLLALTDSTPPEMAGTFARALHRRLGIPGDGPITAYEDPVYYVWLESTLPDDIDPADLDPERADLDSGGHRRRLAQLLDRGLGAPAGHVIPLAWAGEEWQSSPWRLRRQRLFLLPGDSPIGLRLPLDQLPVSDEVVEQVPDTDPLERHLPLVAGPPPMTVAVVSDQVRTALCIEVRAGALFVFLPPVGELGPYLDLVTAVHDTAAELDQPVRIEGYEPPPDERLRTLAVTPDPGVIEVNVQPSENWDDAVDITTTVYALARECRLTAEQFDLDGHHTGTGGGNHITLGGLTPADSPVLRRTDLLQSMVTYWQHHPGLSYLFAGKFIGPTSQAPRVDEARHESLDELEIAFEQLEAHGPGAPPWTVDRLLRNLLVDLTGNTHRAEFCIDKLYPPDTAGRRLGIVELRGFEMPPHPEMSLVQQLLLRCLVARFWQRPYRGQLIRWGTRLHDQFLLPHFVTADAVDVCRELDAAGFPFRPEWLTPFVEFRFPYIGSVQVDDVTLELRRALEPWPVLGEEMTASGTARAVDASLERLQVEIVGATPGRHTVTCNGQPLLLHAAGEDGRYVGGVRYRAWQPPRSLHPTIGVNNPLIFDVVDTWANRTIGGCRYHISHPGGRSYETAPVNANEASGRRISRFWEFGHTPAARVDESDGTAPQMTFTPVGSTPGPLRQALGITPRAGFTVDLRRAP